MDINRQRQKVTERDRERQTVIEGEINEMLISRLIHHSRKTLISGLASQPLPLAPCSDTCDPCDIFMIESVVTAFTATMAYITVVVLDCCDHCMFW